MRYTLTITQSFETANEPIRDASGVIVGFAIPESLGGGEVKPNVCFEVMENARIADCTDISKQEDLAGVGIDDLDCEDFEREFVIVSETVTVNKQHFQALLDAALNARADSHGALNGDWEGNQGYIDTIESLNSALAPFGSFIPSFEIIDPNESGEDDDEED